MTKILMITSVACVALTGGMVNARAEAEPARAAEPTQCASMHKLFDRMMKSIITMIEYGSEHKSMALVQPDLQRIQDQQTQVVEEMIRMGCDTR